MLGSILLNNGQYLTLYPTIIPNNKLNISYYYTNDLSEIILAKKVGKTVISEIEDDNVDIVINKDIVFVSPIEFINIIDNLDEYKDKYLAIYVKDDNIIKYSYIDFNISIIIRQENQFLNYVNGINAGVLGDMENWRKLKLNDGLYIPTNTVFDIPFYLYIRLITVMPDLNIEILTDIKTAYKQYIKDIFGIDLDDNKLENSEDINENDNANKSKKQNKNKQNENIE